ncbi:MAG: preprotein translocase subunit SecA [Chloroflexi bacterium]|nr:preprotein translocase subunit SecA [Chloroflexota bacterium]
MLKWFGKVTDSNDKELKKLGSLIEKINMLEADYEALSNDELHAKTAEFKKRLADGEATNDIIPETFAAVREASKRTIKKRHYDVQLMGGIILHQGKITEMKTGEGKTLAATLPLYLNSLEGKGCHLVTVNDYLARRDPYWMAPIYHALGVSVSSIYPQQTSTEPLPARLYDPDYDSDIENDPWRHFKPVSRAEAYRADITYGTSNEFGFDYLRDNMVVDLKQCVQKKPFYAIVDEIDNLLIDEARTPLIISAPDTEAGQLYHLFARLAPRLQKDADYEIKEKEKNAELSEQGWIKLENWLKREDILKSDNLYDPQNAHLQRHIRNSLNAKEFFKKNHQYIVKDDEIIIVDEFTGRTMIGRRYSAGLHQAIEAKEGVKVRQEQKTYATVTIQNYFRMYPKLAGMTGTALTEAEEFHKIYELEVVVAPTHRPVIRVDHTDQIYKDRNAKFKAVVNEAKEEHNKGRPILIGTVAIETSEDISNLLTKNGIKHEILNAKEHEKEASIIAKAGEPTAVTVATNMAGRGVDIILGGKEPENGETSAWEKTHSSVLEKGGLHVIGTERHESRRIDNQLRGRSGRQGDPGSSRFFVSLEDDLMRRFGGQRVQSIMEWAGFDENTPVENKLITRSVEQAQKRVEGYNFDSRKHLVEYDDVINNHRELIYGERRKILEGADLKSNILSIIQEDIEGTVAANLQGYDFNDWNLEGLIEDLKTILPLPLEINAQYLSKLSVEEVKERLTQLANTFYDKREQDMGAEQVRIMERIIMLRTIDNLWVEHLTAMEDMRQGVGLHAVAQRKPLDVYKQKGHQLFTELLENIKHDIAHTINRTRIVKKEALKPEDSPMAKAAQTSTSGKNMPLQNAAHTKTGRNDPCPCGSGKKYKKCCGK